MKTKVNVQQNNGDEVWKIIRVGHRRCRSEVWIVTQLLAVYWNMSAVLLAFIVSLKCSTLLSNTSRIHAILWNHCLLLTFISSLETVGTNILQVYAGGLAPRSAWCGGCTVVYAARKWRNCKMWQTRVLECANKWCGRWDCYWQNLCTFFNEFCMLAI